MSKAFVVVRIDLILERSADGKCNPPPVAKDRLARPQNLVLGAAYSKTWRLAVLKASRALSWLPGLHSAHWSKMVFGAQLQGVQSVISAEMLQLAQGSTASCFRSSFSDTSGLLAFKKRSSIRDKSCKKRLLRVPLTGQKKQCCQPEWQTLLAACDRLDATFRCWSAPQALSLFLKSTHTKAFYPLELYGTDDHKQA